MGEKKKEIKKRKKKHTHFSTTSCMVPRTFKVLSGAGEMAQPLKGRLTTKSIKCYLFSFRVTKWKGTGNPVHKPCEAVVMATVLW